MIPTYPRVTLPEGMTIAGRFGRGNASLFHVQCSPFYLLMARVELMEMRTGKIGLAFRLIAQGGTISAGVSFRASLGRVLQEGRATLTYTANSFRGLCNGQVTVARRLALMGFSNLSPKEINRLPTL